MINHFFLDIDEILIKLTSLIESKANNNPSNKERNHRKKKFNGPGNGIGFGGASKEIFDAKSINQARSKENSFDTKISVIYDELTRSINRILLSDTVSPSTSFQLRQNLRKHKSLDKSLQLLLRNDCLMDIGSRSICYKSLLSLLSQLSKDPQLVLLLTSTINDQDDDVSDNLNSSEYLKIQTNESYWSLIKGLDAQAKLFLSLQGGGGDNVNAIDDESDENISSALEIVWHIRQTCDDIELGIETASLLGIKDTSGKSASRSNTSQEISNLPDLVEVSAAEAKAKREYLYTSKLRPLCFETYPIIDSIATGKTSHVFYYEISSSLSSLGSYGTNITGSRSTSSSTSCIFDRSRMLRIAKEVSSFLSSLPIEYGSSIFVKCDENRYDIMKALIIGPEGTPYENGCFEFDILLPPKYPSVPPMVQIITTGYGTIRFNPNLYANGKVCLSLLGTWSGPGWNEKTSTILQVLISIQSLILVSDPYFNEPGYETTISSLPGQMASNQYNHTIRQYTLQWAILDQMRTSSTRSVFSHIIQKHFSMKRIDIQQQLQRWVIMTPYISKLANDCLIELKRICKEENERTKDLCLQRRHVRLNEKRKLLEEHLRSLPSVEHGIVDLVTQEKSSIDTATTKRNRTESTETLVQSSIDNIDLTITDRLDSGEVFDLSEDKPQVEVKGISLTNTSINQTLPKMKKRKIIDSIHQNSSQCIVVSLLDDDKVVDIVANTADFNSFLGQTTSTTSAENLFVILD